MDPFDLFQRFFNGGGAGKHNTQTAFAFEFAFTENTDISIRFGKNFFQISETHRIGISVNLDRLAGSKEEQNPGNESL